METICGVVNKEDEQRFRRMIFRTSRGNALIARSDMQTHVAEAMHLSLRLSAVFEHLLEAELASCSPPELVQTMSRATIQIVHDVDRMATLLNDRLD